MHSKYDSPDVDKMFREGQRLFISRHVAAEKDKVGILRAGNTGVVLEDGRVVGKCHRLTALRFLGIEAETTEDLSRELMFDNGRANEDQWVTVLKDVWDGVILREDEVPVQWLTKDGTKVTGRPDIVLARYRPPKEPEGVGEIYPVKGIELKLVSSVWTGRDVLQGKPKAMHLMQAAHYMWQVGVPFELWYTSRVDWPITGWMTKLFPKPDSLYSDVIGYKEDKMKGTLEPFKMFPFRVGYELRWTSDNFIEYRQVYNGVRSDWVKSIISVERIKTYYEKVLEVVQKKNLGSRPHNIEADGSKGGYAICDYCPLKSICDTYENQGYDKWLSAIQKRGEK